MIRKQRIFTPGPTPLLPQAVEAMTRPVHHRSAEFREMLQRVRTNLKMFMNTRHDVVVLGASGTGALEAVSASVIKEGDDVLCVHAGKFGRRWRDMARAFGARVHEIELTQGASATPEQVLARLDSDPRIRAVFIQGSETSTGTLHPIKEIADVLKDRDVLFCVDGISWLGAHDVAPDAWGIDLLVGSSQKSLACPPGLSFVSVSARAEQAFKRGGAPRYSLDLEAELESQRGGDFRFTPPIPLVCALDASLAWVEGIGVSKLIRNAGHLARMTRAAVSALGLSLFSERPSDSVTAVRMPEGLDAGALVEVVSQHSGVVLATGQEESKKAVFRLAHLGYYDYIDTLGMLASVEEGLLRMGQSLKPGAAISAALMEHHRLKETYE
jgi:aspartate aminotransferase-like enzyme